MALIQRLASDLTGTEGAEEEFVTMVLRKHPAITQAVAMDVLPAEIEGIKELKDAVRIEVQNNNGIGQPREIVMSLKDFNSLAPDGDMDSKVESARNLRGRRPGSRM